MTRKRIVIVGASSAIAEQCARLWAAEPADFVLVGRDRQRIERVADDLAELRQAAVQYMICDSLEILAAGAAILFVLRLSALHERKVLEGPYSPAA